MVYTSFKCVLKMSLLLIKIRLHCFGKPVLVCWTLEKASTLIHLCIRFKAQKKKKSRNKHQKSLDTNNLWKKIMKVYEVITVFNIQVLKS